MPTQEKYLKRRHADDAEALVYSAQSALDATPGVRRLTILAASNSDFLVGNRRLSIPTGLDPRSPSVCSLYANLCMVETFIGTIQYHAAQS